MIWAFWVAAALVAVGGAVPILLAGPSGRVSLVIVPYWIAAIALAGCALVQQRGRYLAAGLYFVGGLAVVYGIIAMLAVPLRLAVIGTCPTVGRCAPGFLPPMSGAENAGFGFAVGMGIVGVLVGFFGLVVLWRHTATARSAQAVIAGPPPVRRIPPVKARSVDPQPAAAPPAEKPAEPVAQSTPDDELPELPAPVDELELPAHVEEEAPQLPAPEPD